MADRAGVSRTTASFVLNERADEMRIATATQERVRRAARELEYRPDLLARSLSTGLSRTVALLSDTVATEGYAGRLIEGCVAAAIDHGNMLFVAEFGGDTKLLSGLVDDFVDRAVDGFVCASTYGRHIELPAALLAQPLLLANCTNGGAGIPAVLADDRGAGRAVATLLLEHGHRDGILLVGETPATLRAAAERRAGIEEALAESGQSLAGHVECRWWPESAFEATRAFLDGGERPTALICLNDRVALGAYQALASAGLQVPGAVSVASFDDSVLASWLQPALTSAAIPYRQMGRAVVDQLMAPPEQRTGALLPMPLRERDSVAAPPRRVRRPRT